MTHRTLTSFPQRLGHVLYWLFFLLALIPFGAIAAQAVRCGIFVCHDDLPLFSVALHLGALLFLFITGWTFRFLLSGTIYDPNQSATILLIGIAGFAGGIYGYGFSDKAAAESKVYLDAGGWVLDPECKYRTEKLFEARDKGVVSGELKDSAINRHEEVCRRVWFRDLKNSGGPRDEISPPANQQRLLGR